MDVTAEYLLSDDVDFEIKAINIGDGRTVYIRNMTNATSQEWELLVADHNDPKTKTWHPQLPIMIYVRSACTKDGKFLFPPDKRDEAVEKIGNKYCKWLNNVVDAVMKLHGYLPDKSEDDPAKN